MKIFKQILSRISFAALILLFISSLSFAQERGNDEVRASPNATVSQTIGTTDITISYGRPGVKEREIFGELVPYGEVWRTGANESTALVLSKDVTIEGNELEAGTYSLYTIPGKESWTIIINSKLSWGTEYDESQDVLRFEVDALEGEFMERMMFYFTDVTDDSATLVLRWDEVKVPFTIQV